MHSQLKLVLAVAFAIFGFTLLLTDPVEAQSTTVAPAGLCDRTQDEVTAWDTCQGKALNTPYKSCSVCYKNTNTMRYVYRYDSYKCVNCGTPQPCLIPMNCTGTSKYPVNDGADLCNTFNANTKTCSNTPCSSTTSATMQPYPDPTSACV